MSFGSALKGKIATDGGLGETAAATKLTNPAAAITAKPAFSGYLVDQLNNQPNVDNYKSRQGTYESRQED